MEPHDLPHSGHPVTATSLGMLNHDDVIHVDRWITGQQLDLRLSDSKGSVIAVTNSAFFTSLCKMGFSKSVTQVALGLHLKDYCSHFVC